MSPIQLAEKVVAPALERIGDDWKAGDASLSQVYMSGRICEKLVDEIGIVVGGANKLRPPTRATPVESDSISIQS